jgi:2-iminoacetate synthase ThiH
VIPIYAAWLIQIEITNYCRFKCAHCTRATRHFSKHYFVSLDFVEKALRSLEGWQKGVGCMGRRPS